MGDGIVGANAQAIQRRDQDVGAPETEAKSNRSVMGMAASFCKGAKHVAWKVLSGLGSLAWRGLKAAALYVGHKCQDAKNYVLGKEKPAEPSTVAQVNTLQISDNPLAPGNQQGNRNTGAQAQGWSYRERPIPEYPRASAPNNDQVEISENYAQNVLDDLANANVNESRQRNYTMSSTDDDLYGGALPMSDDESSIDGDQDYQNELNDNSQPVVSSSRQQINEAKNGAFYQSCKNDGGSIGVTKQAYEQAASIVLSRPGATQLMAEHNITLDEAVALHIYTTDAYLGINNEIREDAPDYNNLPTHIKQLKDNFESALSKLPSAEGTSYRGAKLPARVGNTYQPEATITATGLFSSSADSNRKFPDANFSITITLKEGSAGKDISAFSSNQDEQEIAFPTGTQFVVDTRTKDGKPHPDHIQGNSGMMFGSGSGGQLDVTMHEI